MAKTIRVPVARTEMLFPDGRSEIIKDEYADVPLGECAARAVLAIMGTTPEKMIKTLTARAGSEGMVTALPPPSMDRLIEAFEGLYRDKSASYILKMRCRTADIISPESFWALTEVAARKAARAA